MFITGGGSHLKGEDARREFWIKPFYNLGVAQPD